jgi:hypothetical protein
MTTTTEELMMPMPMLRPDPLTGSTPHERSAHLLDDTDIERLIAQAEEEANPRPGFDPDIEPGLPNPGYPGGEPETEPRPTPQPKPASEDPDEDPDEEEDDGEDDHT